MRWEDLVSTACACARFSVYFAVKLSVNVQAHNIRTYRGFRVACPYRLNFVLRMRIWLRLQGIIFMNFQLYRSQMSQFE